MVKEIRVYVEGGGRGEPKNEIRRGFRGFLKSIDAEAKHKGRLLQIIACGSRDSTFKAFKLALKSHPTAFNLLLVDSDTPVDNTPCKYLQKQNKGWDMRGVADEQCHLMVQMMEAWIIADIQTLESYYGQEGFKINAIPKTKHVEQINTKELAAKLKQATRKTKKGEYHKIKHAPDLLERLDAAKVRVAATHCERLFSTLEQKIGD